MKVFRNRNERMNVLILRSLSEEISDRETMKLRNWMAQSENNKKHYFIIKKIWEKSYVDDDTFDVEKALQKVHAKIKALEVSSVSTYSISKHIRYSLGITAAIVLIVTGITFLYPQTEQQAMQTFTAQNDKEAITLPDGSIVVMKKDATIGYAVDFSKNGRTVTFEGEAYFDVVSDENSPFLVVGDHVGVEVLGTTFNLKIEKEAKNYTLDLISGKVRFFSYVDKISNQQEQIMLLPGERAMFDVETNRVNRLKSQGQNFMAWKTGILEFTDTPLFEVFKSLEEVFNIKIEVDDQIKNLRLTARFENESPESILESIETIFEINLIKS